jgi:hypothetical protein
MSDPQQRRTEELISWWPTLDEANGCLDCGKLFRAKNGHCPFCQSHAIINLAEVLRRGSEGGEAEPWPWSAEARVRRRLADGVPAE